MVKSAKNRSHVPANMNDFSENVHIGYTVKRLIKIKFYAPINFKYQKGIIKHKNKSKEQVL